MLALATVAALCMAPRAKAQVSLDIHVGRPGPTYEWVGGYWSEGPHRTWVRPHWEDPPYKQARWHRGRWYRQNEQWERDAMPRRQQHFDERSGPGRGNGWGKGRGGGKGHGEDGPRGGKGRGEGHGGGKGHGKH